MGKPIEPGCVCITVNCRADAAGRMVRVIEPIPFEDIVRKDYALKFGKDGFWWVIPLAGTIPVRCSWTGDVRPTSDAIVCHESQLRRLDDDDTAEHRITEREIEHA